MGNRNYNTNRNFNSNLHVNPTPNFIFTILVCLEQGQHVGPYLDGTHGRVHGTQEEAKSV